MIIIRFLFLVSVNYPPFLVIVVEWFPVPFTTAWNSVPFSLVITQAYGANSTRLFNLVKSEDEFMPFLRTFVGKWTQLTSPEFELRLPISH